MALAQQTTNPGTNGSNARYSLVGLQRLPDGTYTDGTYRYDSNGLSLDRPDSHVPGLIPANSLDGRDPTKQPITSGGGGAGGSGAWGIPNASAYMEMEALAQKAWADTQARLKQKDIQLKNYYGLKTTETDKETGLTSKFEIDPQSLYGAYQQLFRQNADDYNMGQEEGMERGIYGSGLGGQILSDVGYNVGLQRGTMASESVAGFGGLRDEWAQGKYNYDLETLRARLAAAQAGGPMYGPDYDDETPSSTVPGAGNPTTSVGGKKKPVPGYRGGGSPSSVTAGRGARPAGWRPQRPNRGTNRYAYLDRRK